MGACPALQLPPGVPPALVWQAEARRGGLPGSEISYVTITAAHLKQFKLVELFTEHTRVAHALTREREARERLLKAMILPS